CVCHETTQEVLSERKLVEAHAQTEAARIELQDFIMQAPIGIALLSGPDHIYKVINDKFMSLLFKDRKAEYLLNKPVRVALPELKSQGFYEILDGVYRTGKSFEGSKVKASFGQADGSEYDLFINFTYQAKRNPCTGEIDGILALVY